MDILRPISSIMTSDLICLDPNHTISDVRNVFKNNRIHHIPIVTDQKLVGIVSKSDYLFFRKGFIENDIEENLEELRLSAFNVSHIMTKNVAKLSSTDRISVAIEIFKENLFHAIPVVDEDNIVGIVTTYDLLKCLTGEKHHTS